MPLHIESPPTWHFKNTQPFRNSGAEQRQGCTDVMFRHVQRGEWAPRCLHCAKMSQDTVQTSAEKPPKRSMAPCPTVHGLPKADLRI